jgi:LmbE family N-acetylglucosaminyl deacetylase
MPGSSLRLLIIGAHPDDADYGAGGLAALYRAAGHTVKMVSLTNGDAGHQSLRGAELARRRRTEAQAAGAVIGATYEVFDNHDGQLLPTLENRWQVIRLIRLFQPDLVVTHRPNDYHPDHRYTSQLIQDAAYMVTVPAIVPDTPHLSRDPVITYMFDHFEKPYPFRPSVVWMSAECWTKSLPCCIVINRNSMNGCLLMAVIWIKCRQTKSAGANGWPHKSKPACGRERTNTVTWYFTLTARRGERE